MYKKFKGFIKEGKEEEFLIKKIDEKKLPAHIAIIMDGNGRWAKQKNLKRVDGHKRGAESARLILECSARIGIKHLTLFAFSTENWKRPIKEVNALMDMLYNNLVLERKLLEDNKIKFKVLGDIKRLPEKLRKKLIETEEFSKNYSNMQINIALNYGSRMEMIQAIKRIVDSSISSSSINEKLFEKYLYTYKIPDPDLLIRTSGELRISNFLLYQIAYSELYFTETLWPDFGIKEFLEAIIDFQKRKRRLGGI